MLKMKVEKGQNAGAEERSFAIEERIDDVADDLHSSGDQEGNDSQGSFVVVVSMDNAANGQNCRIFLSMAPKDADTQSRFGTG